MNSLLAVEVIDKRHACGLLWIDVGQFGMLPAQSRDESYELSASHALCTACSTERATLHTTTGTLPTNLYRMGNLQSSASLGVGVGSCGMLPNIGYRTSLQIGRSTTENGAQRAHGFPTDVSSITC